MSIRGKAAGFTRELLPSAPRICLECRTVLEGDHCDHAPTHRVAKLTTSGGREQLLHEVWGPPSLRRRMKQMTRAGGTGSGIGALEACAGCEVGPDLGSAVLIAGLAMIFMVVWWIGSTVWRWIQAYRHRLKPAGALEQPRPPPRRTTVRVGRVEGIPSLAAPTSGEACLAYQLELSLKGAVVRRVLLRQASTVGFHVFLDDGDRITVPAGRLRLSGPSVRKRGDPGRVASIVEELSRDFDDEEDYAPFPHEAVDEIVLQPSARVEIRGELDAAPAAGDGTAYRSRAHQELVPLGILDVKILDDEATTDETAMVAAGSGFATIVS